MYSDNNVNFVINYNKTTNIFRVTSAKRVVWDLRNMDVDNLRKAGIVLQYAEDFAQLKTQVRNKLKAQGLLA